LRVGRDEESGEERGYSPFATLLLRRMASFEDGEREECPTVPHRTRTGGGRASGLSKAFSIYLVFLAS
jgi:hypothetical protein